MTEQQTTEIDQIADRVSRIMKALNQRTHEMWDLTDDALLTAATQIAVSIHSQEG